MKLKAKLMDENGISRVLMRIAHEITERNKGVDDICLVGIKRRGAPLAERIRDNLYKIEGVLLPTQSIDVIFYRDDLQTPVDKSKAYDAKLSFEITGKKVIIIDDVLYTGRSVRAAIEAIFAQGRPREIQLATLIDRGHREIPIHADYVGKSIPTSKNELVSVKIPPYDDTCEVLIYERD